jgi:hypothetical protein
MIGGMEPSSTARRAFLLNAVIAWLGVVLTVVFSVCDVYVRSKVDPGLYGDTARGAAGALTRLVDSLSYFTVWSNIVVALSATLLWRDPTDDRTWRRVLRLDALLMILVTFLVYQLVLAPGIDVKGWSNLTDPMLHLITPLLTLGVWLVWGPRGWLTGRVVPLSLILPAVWIAWSLGRGAVVDAYPYGFINVVDLGYATVARNLVAVLVLALVLSTLLWLLDRVLTRRLHRRAAGTP